MSREVPEMTLTPKERAEYGVTITAQHADGRLWSFVEKGATMGALRRACEQIEARNDDEGDGWRVASLSTPITIFRDLQGTRDIITDRPSRTKYADHQKRMDLDDVRSAEIVMLAKVGKRDLLQPRRAMVP